MSHSTLVPPHFITCCNIQIAKMLVKLNGKYANAYAHKYMWMYVRMKSPSRTSGIAYSRAYEQLHSCRII